MRRTVAISLALALATVAFVPGQVAAHDDEDDVCHTHEETTESICNETGEVFGLVEDCEEGTGLVVDGQEVVCIETGSCNDGELGLTIEGERACIERPTNPCQHDVGECIQDLVREFICFEDFEPRCE